MIADLRAPEKKYALNEHLTDITHWWWTHHGVISASQEQTIFFIAYERWLNNRELLSAEDRPI